MTIRDKNFMYAIHFCTILDLKIIWFLDQNGKSNLTKVYTGIEENFANTQKRLKKLVKKDVLKWFPETKEYELKSDWESSLILDYLVEKEHIFDVFYDLEENDNEKAKC